MHYFYVLRGVCWNDKDWYRSSRKKYGYPPQNCGMSDQFPCQYEYIELCVWLCLCDVIDIDIVCLCRCLCLWLCLTNHIVYDVPMSYNYVGCDYDYVYGSGAGTIYWQGGAKCGNIYILIYPILLCSAASSWSGARGVSGASPTDAHIRRAPVQTLGPSLPLATWSGTRWFGLCVERITLSTRGAPKGTGL